jgi:GIY-YIG catalytic domain
MIRVRINERWPAWLFAGTEENNVANNPEDTDRLLLAALHALGRQHNYDALDELVPRQPGLYALYGDAAVWKELGLGAPPDARPVYVGKSASSLRTRLVRTHLRTGKTGTSTPRRALAALLVNQLDLIAVPRNPLNPERLSNYALEPAGDERLTQWMHVRLRMAAWPIPIGEDLASVEVAVLKALQPPLNLKDVRTPWTDLVRQARRSMAENARTRT